MCTSLSSLRHSSRSRRQPRGFGDFDVRLRSDRRQWFSEPSTRTNDNDGAGLTVKQEAYDEKWNRYGSENARPTVNRTPTTRRGRGSFGNVQLTVMLGATVCRYNITRPSRSGLSDSHSDSVFCVYAVFRSCLLYTSDAADE